MSVKVKDGVFEWKAGGVMAPPELEPASDPLPDDEPSAPPPDELPPPELLPELDRLREHEQRRDSDERRFDRVGGMRERPRARTWRLGSRPGYEPFV